MIRQRDQLEPSEPVVAYVALGSNLGDRARTLLAAIKMIDDAEHIEVRRLSHMLQTAPVGGPEGQSPYLNAAAELETTLAPRQLLAVLHEVERRLGRDREHELRWGPRTCDIDILLYSRLVLDEPDLTIPHPRMHERRFMLEPLAQIAPDAMHPVLNKTVRQLLDELGGTAE